MIFTFPLYVQIDIEVGDPPEHVKKGSIMQVLLQPSPLAKFPSSHSKLYKTPSPQIY